MSVAAVTEKQPSTGTRHSSQVAARPRWLQLSTAGSSTQTFFLGARRDGTVVAPKMKVSSSAWCRGGEMVVTVDSSYDDGF